MLGPSLSAASGAGWVSKNNPAARGRAQPAGLLNAVRGIEHHRHAQRLHLGNRPHVVHQPPVAEKRPPLAKQDLATAGGFELADDVLHVAGRHELPFLDVHRPFGPGGRHQQVGLPGQEGRDLQQLADLGRRLGLVGQMDVGGHRQAGFSGDAAQDGQPAFQPGPSI
jgi:hypothetical protein